MDAMLWGSLIAIGVIAVVLFRFFANRRLGRNRSPIEFQEIHRTLEDRVSLNTIDLVFRALGNAYSLDPKLIRPEDSLKDFFQSDSWSLDVGTEKLNQWLQSIGVKEIHAQPKTVLDLLVLVESRYESSRVPSL